MPAGPAATDPEHPHWEEVARKRAQADVAAAKQRLAAERAAELRRQAEEAEEEAAELERQLQLEKDVQVLQRATRSLLARRRVQGVRYRKPLILYKWGTLVWSRKLVVFALRPARLFNWPSEEAFSQQQEPTCVILEGQLDRIEVTTCRRSARPNPNTTLVATTCPPRLVSLHSNTRPKVPAPPPAQAPTGESRATHLRPSFSLRSLASTGE